MFGTRELLVFGSILFAICLLYVLLILTLYRTLTRLGNDGKVPPSLVWLALIPGLGAPVGAFFTGWLIWRLRAFRAEKGMKDSLVPLIVYGACAWLFLGLSFLTRSPAVAALAILGETFLLAMLIAWGRKIKSASSASFQ
ncbi:MAG: hypothetical protein J0L75_02580 [Spirochaetes bacterium]|nr:hypothetical protein [Spirochaetota bacterium]